MRLEMHIVTARVNYAYSTPPRPQVWLHFVEQVRVHNSTNNHPRQPRPQTGYALPIATRRRPTHGLPASDPGALGWPWDQPPGLVGSLALIWWAREW